MEEFIGFLKNYGVYVALPLVINFLLQAFKLSFPKMRKSIAGKRMLNFFPVLLGALGGLVLPLPGIVEKVMVGAALGASAQTIYRVVTRTLGKGEDLKKKYTTRE